MIAGIYKLGKIYVYKGLDYNPYISYETDIITISSTGKRERWIFKRLFGFRLKLHEK